jgi:hypothetical protein
MRYVCSDLGSITCQVLQWLLAAQDAAYTWLTVSPWLGSVYGHSRLEEQPGLARHVYGLMAASLCKQTVLTQCSVTCCAQQALTLALAFRCVHVLTQSVWVRVQHHMALA